MASANFVASNPVIQSEELAKLQQKFVDEIRLSGKDRNPFGTVHELRALVLRDGFRMAERQRPPQNLPYPSLGTLFKGREGFVTDLRVVLEAAMTTSLLFPSSPLHVPAPQIPRLLILTFSTASILYFQQTIGFVAS